jgi:hypothetical protein
VTTIETIRREKVWILNKFDQKSCVAGVFVSVNGPAFIIGVLAL